MIYNVTQEKMRDLALDWVNEKNGIIELGCSSGNFAEKLSSKGITNYCGIDIQQDKITEARKRLPKMNFVCCDIINNLSVLKEAQTFISFQSLEHIEDDLKILKALNKGTNVIISVPNSPYKGHIRWFELEGWEKRFSKYIDFEDIITIQNPKKLKKRAFLFKGVRNEI